METIDLTGLIATTKYQCDFCDLQTISEAYLHNHRRFNHLNEGEVHRCKLCSQTFKFSWAISKHIKELHTVTDELFKCLHCDKIFTSLRNLKRHEPRHDLPQGFENCKQCPRMIKIANMGRHVIEYHQVRDPATFTFKCDKCDYKTYAQRHLNGHRVNKHSNSVMKCSFCSFETPFEVKLQTHNITSHPTLICKVCKFKTNIKSKMRDHKNSHPVECTVCDFQSDSETSMKIHKHIKHQESIKCRKCCLFNLNLEEWEGHIKDKHKIIIHKCHICEFTSSAKKNLKDHLFKKHLLQFDAPPESKINRQVGIALPF